MTNTDENVNFLILASCPQLKAAPTIKVDQESSFKIFGSIRQSIMLLLFFPVITKWLQSE